MSILLSKSTMPIISWVAEVLGILMNGIFYVLNAIGIPNIGLCIILFTLIMYMLMTPLQIKQQKFSKLNNIITPEIQKIQKKYKGKKDQASVMKMQEETQAVYQKYGVSPTGSCAQLLIQMPILFGLYQVIYYIPGYVNGVKDIFNGLVTKIMSVDGFTNVLSTFIDANKINTTKLTETATNNQIIDLLYKLSPSQWGKLSQVTEFKGLSSIISSTESSIQKINSFLGLNLSDTPYGVIKDNIVAGGSKLLVVAAVMIPILAWLTQWLNYKLMPQPNMSAEDSGTMGGAMKSMNTVMPIMSAVFCFSFPVGIGIYWVAGAVVRSIQQLIINRHMDKVDIDELMKQNMDKVNKKRAKAGLPPQKITNQAKMNVRNIGSPEERAKSQAKENEKTVEKSTAYYNNTSGGKAGSIASKANMVKQYNEKNRSK